jgi:hypothetical protein
MTRQGGVNGIFGISCAERISAWQPTVIVTTHDETLLPKEPSPFPKPNPRVVGTTSSIEGVAGSGFPMLATKALANSKRFVSGNAKRTSVIFAGSVTSKP